MHPLVYPNAHFRFVAANGTVGRLISDVLNRKCVQPSWNVCRLGSRVNSSELSDRATLYPVAPKRGRVNPTVR
jgi:hypothetical protein